MIVTFKLVMSKPVVQSKHFQEIGLEWSEEMTEEHLTEISRNWINSKNYLTNKMNGLERVEESYLTIEAMDE